MEQSKHLETATIKIYGQWVDVVNLRTEEYADSTSRIPTMVQPWCLQQPQHSALIGCTPCFTHKHIEQAIGTPEEDAYRRDLTINSLFYNINNSCVEDFTHRVCHTANERVLGHVLTRAVLCDNVRVRMT